MEPYYWFVVLGGLVIVVPLLFTPVGWLVAVVLLGLWLAATLVGRWLAVEYWDLKKTREQGMKSNKVSDQIRGSTDEKRWRR